MLRRRDIVLAILLLLFSIPSYASEAKETEIVEQFGVGFDEVTIADSSDYLNDPRDLEFHPGRANELWIANRATDTITIVENTGLENQTSQNRADSHRNHFLEEVSAISFGAYHPEFDYQWGSAQESRNTYNGQANPNNFMGPALWPSSLSHFAIENQNTGNGLLGSHIDMLHESPYVLESLMTMTTFTGTTMGITVNLFVMTSKKIMILVSTITQTVSFVDTPTFNLRIPMEHRATWSWTNQMESSTSQMLVQIASFGSIQTTQRPHQPTSWTTLHDLSRWLNILELVM